MMFEEIAIPDILKRMKKDAVKIAEEKAAERSVLDQMVAEKWSLHLQDELPKLGSGHRLVTVVKSGPKWTRIDATYLSRPFRIQTRLWDQLKKERKTMNIETLTGAQIVETYNEAARKLGQPEVKKFRDLETGRTRLAKIVEEVKALVPVKPTRTVTAKEPRTDSHKAKFIAALLASPNELTLVDALEAAYGSPDLAKANALCGGVLRGVRATGMNVEKNGRYPNITFKVISS